MGRTGSGLTAGRWSRLHRAAAAMLVAAAGVQMGEVSPADAGHLPSIRLFPSSPAVTVRGTGGFSLSRLGVWAASSNGAFDLRVARASYADPITVNQVDAETGTVLRSVPSEMLDGWAGLRQFLSVQVKDRDGRLVRRRLLTFCPNGWERERVNDGGPVETRYPWFCFGQWLTRGMVWGIEDGWAVDAFGWENWMRLPRGRYQVRVAITQPYRQLFDVPPADGRTELTLRIRPGSSDDEFFFGREAESRSAAVPNVTDPDADTLPDLQALPAWGMGVRRSGNRDRLTFGSTVWNEGPAPLVVEGFRRSNEDVMDAYQYFYRDGEPVGRAPAGVMEYHDARTHRHWHFLQFMRFDLLDASKAQVVRSRKQAFCLVPTDPVDLAVPGAEWNPDRVGVRTACGAPSSIWIRETLDVGWGDTYLQYVSGQAFNITTLPNGTYHLRITVDPLGQLTDGDSSNDVIDRLIRLRGRRGNRRVVVPPWEGIDTESGCPGCGFFFRGEG